MHSVIRQDAVEKPDRGHRFFYCSLGAETQSENKEMWKTKKERERRGEV